MRRLRVLQVTEFFYPYPGGISEHVKYLTERLRERGHEVHVLTTRFKKEDYPQWEDPPYVRRVGRSVHFIANKSVSSVAIAPRISKKVKEIIEEGGYDVIHTHGPIVPTLPLLAVKHAGNRAVVSTFHAAHDESLGYELFKGYLKKYYERVDVRVAVSEVAKRSVERYFPGEFKIIPNGVDVERFRPDLEPIPELAERPTVLFVGRLEPRKGLRFLLRAFPKILERVPEAQLVVVGTGLKAMRAYYKQFIPDEIEDRIKMVGFVLPEELPRYYASASVFCSPATSGESFGIVLLEAMASGTPVVASDIPGYRCVLEDGVQGFLAKPEDPDDIADKILRVLEDPDLAKRMGEAGRQKALHYSWARIAQEIEAVYNEALERRGA